MPKTKLQNRNDFSGQRFYVGLDVHKRSWAVTIRSLKIELAHFSQPPGAEGLSNYLHREFLKLRKSSSHGDPLILLIKVQKKSYLCGTSKKHSQ